MTSRTWITTRLSCNEDPCSQIFETDKGAVATNAAASEAGWTIARKGRHYCPDHARTRGRRPASAVTS